MNQQFLENYKGYNLYSSGDGIAWSDNGGWLNCVFDTVETAKYFIDRRKLIINALTAVTIYENTGRKKRNKN